MTQFYIERGDEWYIEAAVIEADNFDEAFWSAFSEHAPRFNELPVKITDRSDYQTKTVISFCPECCIHVFQEDEWMLTNTAGVYQHVDCYNTDRK